MSIDKGLSENGKLIPKAGSDIDDDQYSKLLSTYVTEKKHVEKMEKERQKLA